MRKHLLCILVLTLSFVSCTKVPPYEELEKDIKYTEENIESTKETLASYSGGLISILTNIRLEILLSTKAMLEQKKTGFKRFIPISYSVDGKKYVPPENKSDLLLKIEKDIEEQQYELEKAQAKWNYDFELMKIGLEGKLERSEARLEAQQQELDYLRATVKPNRTFLWVSTGFIVGTATSVAIFNSVK